MSKRKRCSSSAHLVDRIASLNAKNDTAFTLPELLVAALISAGIAIITAQVMIGQLLEGRRLEVAQRIRENSSRLSYLVQNESSEADQISYDQPVSCAGGGTSVFTLNVPRDDGPYADDTNRSSIHYYNLGDHVWRCGPPVSQNGVLEHGTLDDPEPLVRGRVVANAALALDACDASNDRQVAFSVAFPGGDAGDLSRCVIAHARSIYVCNPPAIPATGTYFPEIGDCPLPPSGP